MPSIPEAIAKSVQFCQQHVRADKKGEAQVFFDRLVMQAYGFNDSDDILEKLLTLNLELAEKEKQGEPVVGSWAPRTE
ncbi:hypothetical protein H6F93_18750 [Leptolyngbya sp. FACHB-671]|uniref:hypothetical protein n=1 Tax=Leptolyngbya sp. FACHB-671 TaxID=2692812 RepID=UPI001684BC7D|nr:hypothetical protein [Leptolyngbya sp. FACHB-671]MBD2069538.1 hypothetical protein [Leptolyngbya sp. FACHB-671]